MAETDADRFRKEAEECRRLAALSRGQHDKEAWLRLAGDWTKLAQSAELNERDQNQRQILKRLDSSSE